MECVERGLGVDEEATSFVLPLGATINMDGTGLYQGVAAVFIATMYNIDLSVGQQLQIVLVAALASIGTAAVPGVGIVVLSKAFFEKEWHQYELDGLTEKEIQFSKTGSIRQQRIVCSKTVDPGVT